MWLATQYGFYSVVRQPDGDDVLVRARVKNDLINLVHLAQLDAEIIETEGADYPFRAVISAAQFEQVMAALAQTLDYENFKHRIGALPDQWHKDEAYGRMASAMRAMEEPSDEEIAAGDGGLRLWPAPDELPSYVTSNPELDALFEEVLQLGRDEEHERALELLERIIAEAPKNPVGYWLKGMHLGSLGRHEEAVWAFNAGLDIEPNDPHALFNMALACVQTGRYEAARVSLRRALEAEPDFNDAMLMLGHVYAQEKNIELPQTLDEWLALHEPGEMDLESAETFALMALAHLALEDRAAARRQWEELRDVDETLADYIAPWVTGEAAQPPGPPDDWEEQNDDLRAALERASRWASRGDAVPAEATEMLLRAFMESWLLVPLGEEPQEGDTGISLSLRSGPLNGLNGEVGLVSFTDQSAADAFFPEPPEHIAVLHGSDLCRALAQMAGQWTESGHAPLALVLNPAGPHAYALSLPSLVFLAGGGVPFDREHAVISEGTQVEIRLPATRPDALLEALLAALESSSEKTGAHEVWWFQVRFGDGDPHFALGVAPGDSETVDAVGRAVNEAWFANVPSLAVYDVLGMDGDMGIRIRNSGELLWKKS